jgi:Fe-S cluster assembly protein SufD
LLLRGPASLLRCRAAAPAAAAPAGATQSTRDTWIQDQVAPLAAAALAAADADSAAAAPRLAALRSSCAELLPALRVPTTRAEEYRFTDMSPLTSSGLSDALAAFSDDNNDTAALRSAVAALGWDAVRGSTLVTVDGRVRADLSDVSALMSSNGAAASVYAGSLSGAPEEAARKLGELSSARGGPFAAVNGALARDAAVLALPAGASLRQPLYVLHLSTSPSASSSSSSSSLPTRAASAPRVLVVLGAGAEAELIEEHASLPSSASSSASSSSSSSSSFEDAVAEVFLAEGARLRHSYAARPGADNAPPSSSSSSSSSSSNLPPIHVRATLVDQAMRSSYSLAEVRAGGARGALTRHDVDVRQLGSDTETQLKHFALCGPGQLHDLHTRLELDHPRAKASQLHKCIAASSDSRGVFDGGVRVGKGAQQTDAGQLTRSLLLAPRATVHARPNLQIVADDVRCTHGCAISDLADEELFYFRARGVPREQARAALVASFGGEVVRALGSAALEGRVRKDTIAALRAADALPVVAVAP